MRFYQTLKNILKGNSTLQIMPPPRNYMDNHPIYGRKDLTPEEKDALALKSDWEANRTRF